MCATGAVGATPDSLAFDPANRQVKHYRRVDGVMRLVKVETEEEYFAGVAQRVRESRGGKDSLFSSTFPIQTPLTIRRDGLHLRTTGRVNLSLGNRVTVDENPALPALLRRRSELLFDEQMNVHLEAGYGERLKLSLDYNTESTMADRRRKLLLGYYGEETDVIRALQVGDVQLVSPNPLIQTGGALFGLRSEMRWGPVEIQAVAAKKEGSTRRIVVRSGGGTRPFEIPASAYDRSRHFFLSEFFAKRYDESLATLPIVRSDVEIEQVEVWVSLHSDEMTDGITEEVGGVVISNKGERPPDNGDDSALQRYLGVSLEDWGSIGREGIEHSVLRASRKLPSTAYHISRELGTISLSVPLSDDRQLVVAYSYRYRGKLYTVGRLNREGDLPAVGALLATRQKSPSSPVWGLMMKNVYALPSGERPRREGFRGEIRFRDYYSTNTLQASVEGTGKTWSEVLGWDVTDESRRGAADGRFDYLEGITVDSDFGTLIIPYRRPFERVPKEVNASGSGAYPVFQMLYDTTQVAASGMKEMDRYLLKGEYVAAGRRSIPLGAKEVVPGSVRVNRGGRMLTEGVDYRINYSSGELQLIGPASPTEQEEVEIIIDERGWQSATDRSMVGLDAIFHINPSLNVGTSWYYYDEESRRHKIRWGSESVRNTITGIHFNYQKSLRDLWDRWNVPILSEMEGDSYIKSSGAFARRKAGVHPDAYGREDILLEDFEEGGRGYELSDPLVWRLGAAPREGLGVSSDAMNHRSLLAWYRVSPWLVREGSEYMPEYIRNNPHLRSDIRVREVAVRELFPEKYTALPTEEYLPILNISYYPDERGPYNLRSEVLLPDGKVSDPREGWAGMMRPLTVTDFESEGISYLEGWMMVPPSVEDMGNSGALWIEIGRVSDAIFPGESISYESGLPSQRHPDAQTKETPFGRIPQDPPRQYLFDFTDPVSLSQQDVGLNGLSSADELQAPNYRKYLEEVRSRVEEGSAFRKRVEQDPAGDDYRFFLDPEWDREMADILTRYKYINGTEGNSSAPDFRGLSAISTREPDAEDLQRDFVKDLNEDFFRYKLRIDRNTLRSGGHFVSAIREVPVTLPDGSTQRTRWIKIRIPLSDYQEKVGNPDRHDTRAIRMIFTGFDSPVHFRWASLRLVRSDWRTLVHSGYTDRKLTSQMQIERVGLEEDASRIPVSYVLPPGVEREVVRGRLGTIPEDEQSLALRFTSLQQDEQAAVFRVMGHNLTDPEELALYAHAESLPDALRELANGDAILYLRLGRDQTENYYEVSYPLYVTPPGSYLNSSPTDRRAVWRAENELNLALKEWIELKKRRDREGFDSHKPYTQNASHPGTLLTVQGHPSLSDVRTMVIGVRTSSQVPISGEVWVNEIRVRGRSLKGGDAAQLDAEVKLADLTRWHFSLSHLGAGFGSLDSDVRGSAAEQRTHYLLRGEGDPSRLFPFLSRWHTPIHWEWRRTSRTPLYDPFAGDILLRDMREDMPSSRWREYLRRVSTRESLSSLSLPDWRWDTMKGNSSDNPWDASHLRFSLHHLSSHSSSPEVSLHRMLRSDALLGYHYESQGRRNSLLPRLWHLESCWDRYLERMIFGDAPLADKSSTLSHYFRWGRSLKLSWRLLPGLTYSWDSSTDALIEEPSLYYKGSPEALHYAWRDSVIHSLLKLGTPYHSHFQSEWRYSLPTFSSPALQSLRGDLSYIVRQSWDRGAESGEGFRGHRLTGTSDLDAHITYDLNLPWRHATLRPEFRWHQTRGRDIPGLLPEAGPVFGILQSEIPISSRLASRFGLISDERYIRKMIQHNLLVNAPSLESTASYYRRVVADGLITLQPWQGVSLELSFLYSHYSRGEMRPSTVDRLPLLSGNLRMSTVGLSHFFDNVMDKEGYATVPAERFVNSNKAKDLELRHSWGEQIDPSESLTQAFVESYMGRSSSPGLLPSARYILPNWSLSLDLPYLRDLAPRWVDRVTFKHRYRGTLEVDEYRQHSDWVPMESPSIGTYPAASGEPRIGGRYDIRSMTQRDEMSPLIGVSVRSPLGLTVDAHYNRSRSITLLAPVSRLLEQYRTDLMGSLRWRLHPRALFVKEVASRSTQGSLLIDATMVRGENFIVTRDIIREDAAAGLSFRTRSLKTSLDYAITSTLSIRCFYEWDSRRPLVSGNAYPFTTTYYGVLLHLTLRP